jgi:DNA-directed RNA polymerase subunit RPC12/RpoP
MTSESHKYPPVKELQEAYRSGESVGYCLACGAKVTGIEPDAREYKCEECDSRCVYGIEEVVLMAIGFA